MSDLVGNQDCWFSHAEAHYFGELDVCCSKTQQGILQVTQTLSHTTTTVADLLGGSLEPPSGPKSFHFHGEF